MARVDTDPRRPLGDVTSELVAASTIEDVWDIYCRAMHSYQFDRLLYGATRFPEQGFLGNLDEALILWSGPYEYVDIYVAEELYLQSPSYTWAESNTGFISWPDAARQFAVTPTPAMLRIWELNQQFGLTSGYVGSLRGVVPGMNGVIGISATMGIDQAGADAIWAEVGGEIETLTKMMHLRVASLPQTGCLRPLTSRQREVLEWYSVGKTTQDIATIMKLSAATVEKHMRSARQTLDAATTAHAVKKAMSLNLLTAFRN